MKLLFICNQNKHRSLTAENLFKAKFDTQSAGLYNDVPVTQRQLEWADVVFVMEDFQRSEIAKRFPSVYLAKRILSLNIPDEFSYGQPELERLLVSRLTEALSTHQTAS